MSSNVRPVAVATLAFAVFSGSQIQAAEPNTGERAGVPQDWSQRALVYTNPSIRMTQDWWRARNRGNSAIAPHATSSPA